MKNQPARQGQKGEASKDVPIWKMLGPGLITGASDDDPSGIATYSQAGAKYGFGMLWTLVLAYPLMVAIQEISAVLGRVTGRGLAGNLHRYYPRWVMYPTIILLLVANIINLAADLNVMGTALKMLIGGWDRFYVVGFAIGSTIVQIRVPYARYAQYLKWLCLALFAYVATAFVVKVDWSHAFYGTLVPKVAMDSDGFTMLIAILGTTISPYLFFWQASGEVEELEDDPQAKALRTAPAQAPAHLRRIKWDTLIGMAFSNVIAWFIILTVAATLNSKGSTEIQTATEAAEMLKPVAGPYAFVLFAAGIIGTGLLALPVLSGSAAYAVGEAFQWTTGLNKPAHKARGFYAIIVLSMILGVGANFAGLDPIKALFWTAVINGVIAAPVMVTLMLMATNPKVMGPIKLPQRLRWIGWAATAFMVATTVAFFITLAH